LYLAIEARKPIYPAILVRCKLSLEAMNDQPSPAHEHENAAENLARYFQVMLDILLETEQSSERN
jgi:hypothetical protein